MEAEQPRLHRRALRLATLAGLARPVQHDLNNLLTVVFANLEMLKRTAAEGMPQRQLDRIQEAARRFDASTRAILDLIRQPIPGMAEVALPTALAALRPLLVILLPAPGALILSLGPLGGAPVGGAGLEARDGAVNRSTATPQDWLVRLDRAALDEALLALARDAAEALPRGAGLTLGVANRPGADGAPDAVEFCIRRPEGVKLPALEALREWALATGGDAMDEAAGGAATLRLRLPRTVPRGAG